MKKDQLWRNLLPRVRPHSIQSLHRVPYLPRSKSSIGTLHTTVKWPNSVRSWSRCRPGRAWSWSMDTVQTPVGLIHIHVMHNWGIRPKIIPLEARHITKSMVMWLILTRIWMTILELIWGRFCNEYATWCCINLFRSLKRLLYYHWMKKDPLWSNLTLQSDCTASNPCTGYPTYHSQTARTGPKME